MFNFLRRQQWYHLFGCEKHANRAITTQSWAYLAYLRDLAVRKDYLPHHRMVSQSAKQLCNYDSHLKCLHDDTSGPCVSLLILAPELGGTVPLICALAWWSEVGHLLDKMDNQLDTSIYLKVIKKAGKPVGSVIFEKLSYNDIPVLTVDVIFSCKYTWKTTLHLESLE